MHNTLRRNHISTNGMPPRKRVKTSAPSRKSEVSTLSLDRDRRLTQKFWPAPLGGDPGSPGGSRAPQGWSRAFWGGAGLHRGTQHFFQAAQTPAPHARVVVHGCTVTQRLPVRRPQPPAAAHGQSIIHWYRHARASHPLALGPSAYSTARAPLFAGIGRAT